MTSTTIIPIFGYTPEARKQQIELDGEQTTVELAIAATKNIIRIEATPSTWNLHKYLVVADVKNKDTVQKEIKKIFGKIAVELKQQPPNFPYPRCGGSEKSTLTFERQVQTEDKTTSSYMVGLEMLAMAQNPQDAGPTVPPKRHRKMTISYANAAKAGILRNHDNARQFPTSTSNHNAQKIIQDNYNTTQDSTETNSTQRQVTWDTNTMDTSRSTGSSLSRSMTNSKIQNIKKDIDSEIKELKEKLEIRMDQQDRRINDILQMMQAMNSDMETRMAQAVIMALVKEKSKVEELTHGRTFDPSEAPLADENGILPFGAKAQSGGPLHRLHHVEVTVQHMAAVLDTIADHLQQDPTARHLFPDDNRSETSTTLEADQCDTTRNEEQNDQSSIDQDVSMTMIREYGGIKRLHGTVKTPAKMGKSDQENHESPNKSPPTKRERSDKKPSANPDGTARERGET